MELEYHKAAVDLFGSAASGQQLARAEAGRRSQWAVDILVPDLAAGPLVIEYDGAYWHRNKTELDKAKSLDLLTSGHRVVRLREHPLGSLGITDPRYQEFRVHATAPDPVGVLARVQGWTVDRRS